MITLWRIFKYSWKNVFRNAWLGLATVFVFMMALLSVNVLLGVNVLLENTIQALEQKIDVTVTFKKATPVEVINQARFFLTSLPQVAGIKVITAEEALANFKARHADRDPKVISALNELSGNPLGAQLVIKAKDVSDYPFLLQTIQNPQYASFIQDRTYDDHQLAIAWIQDAGRKARIFGAILVAIFAFFGALIAFNAIRVAVYTQREEITIMRLVGASSFFIRGPFILEGIWLALFSFILSFALLIGVSAWLDNVLPPLFDSVRVGSFLLTFFREQWPTIVFVEGVGMFGLVALVSWAAVGKYIKR
ncbi:FtsX-like permease family protein [Candidatus Uhrbacteria bacterium]|nr:FtsX-like permease family protein [Candidatus Uhrbacteria bacterium]